MSKRRSPIDAAIAQLEDEIRVRQAAIAALQANRAAPRRDPTTAPVAPRNRKRAGTVGTPAVFGSAAALHDEDTNP